jgi:hypothetical protein
MAVKDGNSGVSRSFDDFLSEISKRSPASRGIFQKIQNMQLPSNGGKCKICNFLRMAVNAKFATSF